MLIDSHCHLDFPPLCENLEELLASCKSAGLQAICIPAVTPQACEKIIQFIETQQSGLSLYFSVGLHPWWVDKWQGKDLSAEIAAFIDHPNCIAIGECGLDGFIDTDLEKQKIFFRQQLELAQKYNKPVIVHSVKAHAEVLKLLKVLALSNKGSNQLRGVIHAFTGSKEIARQYTQLGFYLGVGGSITYPRANKTINAIKATPVEFLLLETDAPDMPLSGSQGEANSPLRLKDVADTLAKIREQGFNEVALQTTKNFQQLFGVK